LFHKTTLVQKSNAQWGKRRNKMNVQTHNLVTGDVTKFQELLKEKGLYNKVVNERPVLKTIPVSKVIEIEAQRDTQAGWAYKQIVKRNGVDNGIFEPISVMEEDDGFFYCYDGLGRTAIYQLAGLTDIDAWVSTGSKVEAASRFTHKNKYGIRSVSPESIFSAEVESQDPEAVEDVGSLGKIGLCVRTNHNKVIPTASKDPQIKLAGFKKAMKFADGNLEVLRMARDIIVDAYPEVLKDNGMVRADLFVGLVIVLNTFEILQRPGKPFEQLQEFISSYGKMMEQVKLPFKKEGGNQHNKESESVAYGIVKLFTQSKFVTSNTTSNVRHKVLRERYDLAEQRV
jgi:hypothetical protein